jgi:peptidoglycan L-alanyl-D-glutamate endopeptidase CwlK
MSKFKLSETGAKRLSECDERLQKIVNELLDHMDVSVLCGYRGEKEQNEAFKNGNSKLKFPMSKHNKKPSLAVDLAPYPIDWNDIGRFDKMLDKVQEIADKHGVKVRLGRTFKFKDYPHIELV